MGMEMGLGCRGCVGGYRNGVRVERDQKWVQKWG